MGISTRELSANSIAPKRDSIDWNVSSVFLLFFFNECLRCAGSPFVWWMEVLDRCLLHCFLREGTFTFIDGEMGRFNGQKGSGYQSTARNGILLKKESWENIVQSELAS